MSLILAQHTQRLGLDGPEYSLAGLQGSLTDRRFKMNVTVAGKVFTGLNWLQTKEAAKDEAAQLAIKALGLAMHDLTVKKSTDDHVRTQNLISKTIKQDAEIIELTRNLKQARNLIEAKEARFAFLNTQTLDLKNTIKSLEQELESTRLLLSTASQKRKLPQEPSPSSTPTPAKKARIKETPSPPTSRKHPQPNDDDSSDAEDLLSRSSQSSSATLVSSSSHSNSPENVHNGRQETMPTLTAWPDLLFKVDIDYYHLLDTKSLKIKASKSATQFFSTLNLRLVYVKCVTIKGFDKPFLAVPFHFEAQFLDYMLGQDWIKEVKKGDECGGDTKDLKKKGDNSKKLASTSSTASISASSPPTLPTSSSSSFASSSSNSSSSTTTTNLKKEGEKIIVILDENNKKEKYGDNEEVVEVPLQTVKSRRCKEKRKLEPISSSPVKHSPLKEKNVNNIQFQKPESNVAGINYESLISSIMPAYKTLSQNRLIAIRQGVETFLEATAKHRSTQPFKNTMPFIPLRSIDAFKEWVFGELTRIFPKEKFVDPKLNKK
ncbi:UNVERIFIED_CONTAM: hypothetical protein HDU68_007339 [Siphonaria sp. JEL0065]|nr:hypothetical protein HDU68_007339 [Siphonaria sp. JEL0065]